MSRKSPQHIAIMGGSARSAARTIGARHGMAWRIAYGRKPTDRDVDRRRWRDAWREIRAEWGPAADVEECYRCYVDSFTR